MVTESVTGGSKATPSNTRSFQTPVAALEGGGITNRPALPCTPVGGGNSPTAVSN